MSPFWSAFFWAFGGALIVAAVVAYISSLSSLIERFGWRIHVFTVLLGATVFGAYVGIVWSSTQ